MSLTRRGKRAVYYYDFEYDGRRYHASTRTSDPRKAGRVEAMAKAAAYRGA